jgi:transposase
VLGKTASRHTSAEFVAFLTDLVTNQPNGKEIHVIADNLSAHKTPRVDEFLTQYPRVHLHFPPTYSSWLNHVELWFAKYPALQYAAQTREVEVLRCVQANYSRINCYSPLV